MKEIQFPFGEPSRLPVLKEFNLLDTTAKLEDIANSKSINEKLYDLSRLVEISRGDENFIIKMVKLCIEETPSMVTEMLENYQQGNYRTMAALAHKIKTVIDNIGIVSLKDSIIAIERKGIINCIDESLPDLLIFVKTSIDAVVKLLEEELLKKKKG